MIVHLCTCSKGLGRNGEGRVEPVEIKILPAGKSLDMCAEMRERGKLRKAPGEGEGKRKRKRKRKRKLVEAARLQEAEVCGVCMHVYYSTLVLLIILFRRRRWTYLTFSTPSCKRTVS